MLSSWYLGVSSLGSLAGILLLATSYFLPATVNAHSQTNIIKMVPGGFEPQTIKLDINSALIFLNEDSQDRWPASNTHPTHDIYPEFDPKRPIKPGESWSFKPKKTGVYKFHDHLLPHYRGSIEVEVEESDQRLEISDQEDSNQKWWDDLKSWFSGLWDKVSGIFNKKGEVKGLASIANLPEAEQFRQLTEHANGNGADKTWEEFKRVFKGQAGSSGSIHDLAHLSGSLLYQQLGFPGLAECSADFSFGCYHGFLDKAFEQNLDGLQTAQVACFAIGAEGSGPVASCIHGIGHGIASYYTTADLDKSLETCRQLKQSGWEYCWDGVFMEYTRGAANDFYKMADPLYPCSELEVKYGETYSFSCGRNQPSVLMGRLKMGLEQVIGVCLSSSSAPLKRACFDSIGFSVASSANPELIIKTCSMIGVAEYTSRCVNAAAGELVFQEVPNWPELSKQVCNGYPVSLSSCLEHINRLIREYGRKLSYNFPLKLTGEDINSYIKDQLGICYEGGGRDGCYKSAAEVLYQQFGLKETLNVLKVNEGQREVYARCHEVTHYLSRFEYEKQRSIAGVYSQCDSTCHGGCYHGTLEAYLKEKQIDQDIDLGSEFSKACGSLKDYRQPLEYYECLHGLGHAAMFVTEMELLKSLSWCDRLSSEGDRGRCYTGVFMENSSSSTSLDHTSKYVKADDPFYPCNSIEERYQPLCWQYQSSYFAILYKQDWGKVAQLCLQVPAQYQTRCFRAVGTNQVGFTTDLKVMRDDCNLMPNPEAQDSCVQGVISSLSYRFVGDLDKMSDFCQLVQSNNKESCYKQIGYSVMDWGQDKSVVADNCQRLPGPQAVSWCLSVM